VAFDVEVLALGAPIRIIEPVEIGDLVGIGKRGIAHPDPQPMVALDHGIALDPRRAWNRVLARHPHAGAGLVVAKAMVMALQGVADKRPQGEGKMAVRAAILERDRRAVFEPIEHDGLAENDAPEWTPSDLVVIGRDVPVVSEEHGLSSRSIAA